MEILFYLTNMYKQVLSHKILAILTILVTLGVLIFDIFHYSSSYGIVEINSINSLFLVPFIVLVCWLGMLLGSSRQKDEFEWAYQNKISRREREVIALMLQGKKNQEISDELFVDISTVKSHIHSIYKKTGIKNRKELLAIGKSVLKKD